MTLFERYREKVSASKWEQMLRKWAASPDAAVREKARKLALRMNYDFSAYDTKLGTALWDRSQDLHNQLRKELKERIRLGEPQADAMGLRSFQQIYDEQDRIGNATDRAILTAIRPSVTKDIRQLDLDDFISSVREAKNTQADRWFDSLRDVWSPREPGNLAGPRKKLP